MIRCAAGHFEAFGVPWFDDIGVLASSTHARAAASGSADNLIHDARDLAFSGAFMLTFEDWESVDQPHFEPAAHMVPPPPGKIPTRISGKPTLAFGLEVQKMRWSPMAIPDRCPQPCRAGQRRWACRPCWFSGPCLRVRSCAARRAFASCLQTAPRRIIARISFILASSSGPCRRQSCLCRGDHDAFDRVIRQRIVNMRVKLAKPSMDITFIDLVRRHPR